ncbi:MAG TPA: SET domain-containing protein [Aggregatilineaceae bacterium]|nr:SET domain-containing protein [Aggregatilineaceae bacterium]
MIGQPRTIASTDVRHFVEDGIAARYIGAIGWGLFAEKAFVPGDTIYWIDLREKRRSRVMTWHDSFEDYAERSFTVALGFAVCCLADHPFWYSNHSCLANSGFVNWGRLEKDRLPIAAYRPIHPGQQITLDYSLFTPGYDGGTDGRPWSMSPCLCEHDDCRITITDFDHLPLNQRAEALMTSSPVRGRILAHMLPIHPALVNRLRNARPVDYAVYIEALHQQIALSARLQHAIALA